MDAKFAGPRSGNMPPMLDARPRIPHEPALDGIRGVAVAGVLLFHGGHLVGGYLGVDAFFVLSGFLITSLLLAEARDSATISLRRFWARRARRLLPALGCVIAAVAIYAAFVARPSELATIRGDAFATLAYVANWRQVFTSNDYFALFRSPSPLQHTWSLAIEEQFYLLWPLLTLALVRGRDAAASARRVLVVAVALVVGSFAWSLVLFDRTDPSRVYYGTDTRISSILVGAALAAALARYGAIRSGPQRAVLEAAATGAVAGLAVAWTRLSGASPTLYRGGLLACALGVAVVIAAAVHPGRGPVAHALSVSPLRSLGVVSYGVYLWHWPVYVVLDEQRVHLGGWPLLAVRVTTTLAIAACSYVFVERSVRHGAGSRRVMLRLTPAIAAGLVVAMLAATTGATSTRAVAADRIRVATAASGTARVLVVGNSMALFAADEGLKQLHTTPPLDVLNLGSIGCRILPEVTRSRFPGGGFATDAPRVCRDDWSRAVEAFHPDVVMVVLAEPTDAEYEIDGHWTAPCEAAYDGVLEREFHDQTRLLGARGAHVVITTTAYTTLPLKSAAWLRHNDCYNAVVRRVAQTEPGVVLADVFTWLCPRVGRECVHEIGAITLRPDGVHFRDSGARLFAAWMLGQLQRRGILADVRVDDPVARLLTARTRPCAPASLVCRSRSARRQPWSSTPS